MTLPLAIRPRIRLRDEPERSRAAWAPPLALPVTVYWVVMGFLTYGVSRAPSWLATEGSRPEISAGDTSPVQRFTQVVATPSETPSDKVDLSVVQEERPRVRDEVPVARSTFDQAPTPPKVTETPPERPLLERRPALSTPAKTPYEAGPARHARRSRHDDRSGGDSLDTAGPSSLALRFDPVPQEPIPMRDVSTLPIFVPAPADAPSAPPIARRMSRTTSTLPSCESAAAAANNEWDLTAARGAPDLSRDSYAAVLEHGAYFSHCAVPAGTALDICAAVQKGHAIGITVAAHPANPGVSACVKAAVESLSFPSHPRLDVTRTHFEAMSGR